MRRRGRMGGGSSRLDKVTPPRRGFSGEEFIVLERKLDGTNGLGVPTPAYKPEDVLLKMGLCGERSKLSKKGKERKVKHAEKGMVSVILRHAPCGGHKRIAVAIGPTGRGSPHGAEGEERATA